MKAFDFRLQTKLNISIRQEDIARENLQASLNVRNEIAQQLDQLVDRVQAVKNSIREQNNSSTAFSILVASREYLPVLNMRKNTVASHLKEAESEVETARGKLVERARETGTLEKLKKRQWQEYQKEALQHEQKVIDELALSNHFRKKTTNV
ncbi:MAG: flagellar export protein FliJ [Syntrophomonadaceae bacterium]|jgi:flagellar FliJ protein